jgi:hypothetical protein
MYPDMHAQETVQGWSSRATIQELEEEPHNM